MTDYTPEALEALSKKAQEPGALIADKGAFLIALETAYRTGQLILAQPSGDVGAAKMRDDAARYRWLRDHSVPPHNFYISVPDEFHGVKYSPDEVDAYIDAARAALGEKP